MTRVGADAIAYARGRVGGSTGDPGMCLQFTRQCFEVAAYYASAIDAGLASQYPHPNDPNIPPATPVYFSSASVYDHVAFYISDAEVITTWNADIRSYPMSRMLSDYGPYRGWAEDLNTVRVYAPTIPPELEGADMKVVHATDTNNYYRVGELTFVQLGTMDYVRAEEATLGPAVETTSTVTGILNRNVIAAQAQLRG